MKGADIVFEVQMSFNMGHIFLVWIMAIATYITYKLMKKV